MSSGSNTPTRSRFGDLGCGADTTPNLNRISPKLIITTTTVLVVAGVLLCLKPRFIMIYDKQRQQHRLCWRKLLLWMTVAGVVVHCNCQMIRLYGLLLKPMKIAWLQGR